MSEAHEIRVFYSDEDGGYISDVPSLHCCSAFGDTPEEALAQLRVAERLWLEAKAERSSCSPRTRPDPSR